MYFPNISAFDIFDSDDVSGQEVVGTEDVSHVTAWVGGGVPSLILIVLVFLVLVKQNMDRFLQLFGQASQLLNRFMDLFVCNHENGDQDVEVVPAVPPTAVVVVPRNLSDSERIAMRPCPNGGQWIWWDNFFSFIFFHSSPYF